MKEKDSNTNLVIILLILAIIIIIVMGIFLYKIYNEKLEETEKSVKLQEQIDNLNYTATSLQEKIDSISKITTSEKSNDGESTEERTSSEINILDGKYVDNQELEAYIYEFSGNKMDDFPDGQTVELTILDENILVDKNGTKYIKE